MPTKRHRVGKRAQPGPKRPRKPTAAQSSRANSSPFMSLPLEIRLNVYSYFEEARGDYLSGVEIDSIDDDNTKESWAIARTRTALLGVSKRISEEWAPFFYRPHQFVVGAKLPPGVRFTRSGGLSDNYSASSVFGRRFLDKLSPAKLHSIRKLEYDVDWFRAPYLARWWLWDGKPPFDFHGLSGLPRVLQNSGIMQSLETVRLAARYQDAVYQYGSSDLAYWWGRATRWEDESFENIRRLYQSRTRNGLFRCWNVEGRVLIGVDADGMAKLGPVASCRML